MAPNVPAVHELHFAVPMVGGVICTLNSRHDSSMLSILLQHCEAKIIFVDHKLLPLAHGAIEILRQTNKKQPILVLINEPDNENSSNYEYESLLQTGESGFQIKRPDNEWDPISINYTSGTTSRPKGVVYNHRGAYLNSLATVFLHGMAEMPVYLWTVPMFHCNGWCLIWGVAAQGGTNVCLRRVTPRDIFESIPLHNVTHLGAVPTVLNMIANSAAHEQRSLPHKVQIMTGGSPPPPQVTSCFYIVSRSFCN